MQQNERRHNVVMYCTGKNVYLADCCTVVAEILYHSLFSLYLSQYPVHFEINRYTDKVEEEKLVTVLLYVYIPDNKRDRICNFIFY